MCWMSRQPENSVNGNEAIDIIFVSLKLIQLRTSAQMLSCVPLPMRRDFLMLWQCYQLCTQGPVALLDFLYKSGRYLGD